MSLLHFFLSASDGTSFVAGTYSTGLVWLSACVAVCLSLVALHTANLARSMQNADYRRLTIAMAAFALGIGIWTMHFVGMLAFRLPVPMHHHVGLTVASLLPAWAASWLALNMLAKPRLSGAQLLGSGFLMGAGIGTMHYVGMAAMQVPLAMRFVPSLFLLSVAVAVVLAMLALWVHFGLRNAGLPKALSFVLGGLVMGLAISAMHYMGMAAVRFVGTAGAPAMAMGASDTYAAPALASVAVGLGMLVAAVNSLIRSRELYRMMEDSKHVLQRQLEAMVAKVRENAVSVGGSAREIAAGSGELGVRIQQQAASLQETAASMEQITTTVEHNASNTARAEQLARDVLRQAEQGSGVITGAVAAMREIHEASGRISAIVGLIDEIAFQTNLLALNAAVEAARAGSQGQGFAVVAQEVRNLATRSAASAQDIKQLVARSAAKVDEGAAQVELSGKAFAGITESVQRVSAIVAEIASASGEQSKGIAQIGKAVTEMDGMTRQNTALVQKATGASQSLEAQAEALEQHVLALRLEGVPA